MDSRSKINSMEINIHPFQHFSFDLWLTLIRSNPLYKKKRAVLFKEHFSIKTSIEETLQTLRHYDVLYNRLSEKTGLHFHRNQIYLQVLKHLNVDEKKINEALLHDFYKQADDLFLKYRPSLIRPDIYTLLNKIRLQGKTLNILSNTAFIHGNVLRKLLLGYGLSDFFSFQLYSDETGYAKPHPKMFGFVFENVQATTRIRKNQIVHIGDNEIADFYGAQKAGFHSILINHTHYEPQI